jgi:hypothetical protein
MFDIVVRSGPKIYIFYIFPRKALIPNFTKICPVGSTLIIADRRKDRRDKDKRLQPKVRKTSKEAERKYMNKAMYFRQLV